MKNNPRGKMLFVIYRSGGSILHKFGQKFNYLIHYISPEIWALTLDLCISICKIKIVAVSYGDVFKCLTNSSIH